MKTKFNIKNLSSRNWKIERQTPYVGMSKSDWAYLRQFDFEFSLSWFLPGAEPLHKECPVCSKVPKELRTKKMATECATPEHLLLKQISNANNASNRDIYSKAIRRGKMQFTGLDAESVFYPRSKRDKKDE